MNSKYAGATIVLPKVISEKLDVLRERVGAEMGFELSRADTVAFLIRAYEKHNPPTVAPEAGLKFPGGVPIV